MHIKINKSLAKMVFHADHSLASDPGRQAAKIAGRAKVPVELVEAAFRKHPLTAFAQSDLERLGRYLDAGAKKPRTPHAHQVILTAAGLHLHAETMARTQRALDQTQQRLSRSTRGRAASALGEYPALRSGMRAPADLRPSASRRRVGTMPASQRQVVARAMETARADAMNVTDQAAVEQAKKDLRKYKVDIVVLKRQVKRLEESRAPLAVRVAAEEKRNQIEASLLLVAMTCKKHIERENVRNDFRLANQALSDLRSIPVIE